LDALLRDRRAICQMDDGDQDVVEENRVARADPEVATGEVFAESSGTYAHRPDFGGERMLGDVQRPVADPLNRPAFAARRHHEIADSQGLDGDFPAFGQDGGAAAIAGDDEPVV
jgi:hypothetical protein